MDKVMIRPTKRAGREKWVNRRMADVLVKMGVYEIVDDTPAVQAEPVKAKPRARKAAPKPTRTRRRVTAKAAEPEAPEPEAEPESAPEPETEVEFTPAPALEAEVETPKRNYHTRRLKAED